MSPPLGRSARVAALVCSLVVALALLPGAAAATAQPDGDTVVGPNETVDGDLTATTGDVLVRGTVDGDVSAMAGSVRVTGEVTDSVSAAAGSVTVHGTVGGDVSAAAGSVDVGENATVGGDATAAAGSVELGSGSTVEGDASAGAGSVVVPESATVEGDANAGGGDAEIDGTVEGDVTTGQSAVLGSTAVVAGDVTYGDDVDRADGATVRGSVEHDPDTGWNVGGGPSVDLSGPVVGGALVPGVVPGDLQFVYWTLLALLIGGGLLALFPRFTADVARQATTDPVRTSAAGFAALIGVPFVLFAVFMTIIGIPVALAGTAVFVLVAWASLVYGEYLAGRQLLHAFGEHDRWLALVVGVVGVELLSQIPLLGGLLKFAVLLVGLGATALAIAGRWNGDGEGEDGDTDERPAEPPAPDPAPDPA